MQFDYFSTILCLFGLFALNFDRFLVFLTSRLSGASSSIFVNPTQFLPGEDLAKYPRDFDGDCKKLAAAGTHFFLFLRLLGLIQECNRCDVSSGADAVFFLTPATMYPNGYQTFVKLEGVDENSKEGSCRPGHFRGVATVVTKLFNLTQPTKAFFGQKDGMQW